MLGYSPATIEPGEVERKLTELRESKVLRPAGLQALAFDPAQDIVFNFGPPLPGHANGLILEALDGDGKPCLSETYYSIGGGFIVTAAERAAPPAAAGGR